MTKLHLDTDIGGDIDDVCALALLLRAPDVEITGVTTVLEDGGRRAGYARYVLDLAGRSEVPVAAGASVQLGPLGARYGLPPEERYWPEPVPPVPGALDAALDLLEASIGQGAAIVAVGPFTNLSLLQRRSTGILKRADLYLMGGSIFPPPPGFPQRDYTTDFNVQADAAAARHVLESADPERTTLVPLEVTVQTALTRSQLPALRGGSPLGELIARQAEACAEDWGNEERYGRTCPGLPDDTINFQHDPLTCAVALGWSGVKLETLPLTVAFEGKWLRLRVEEGGRPMRVVTAVDGAGSGAFWLETVTGVSR